MQTETFENERWERGSQSEEFRHREALRLIEGDSVLDLGCGDGLFLSLISDSNIRRYGVDISPVAIARLKERGLEGEVCNFSEDTLPFADNAFASVVSLDVMEHLFFPERLLTEALRVSSECVVISVPNFSSLPARIAVMFGRVPENNRPKKGHCYWFTLSVLRAMVERSGGQVVFLRVNTFWERRPVIGSFMSALAEYFPSVFGLSFVAVIRKREM